MATSTSPCALIVMGVSGSGKTTIGERLAARISWRYEDADTFHPPGNVAKMSAGQPLTDEDRRPWLAEVTARIDGYLEAGQPAVLACSLLKRRYRDQITAARPTVRIVFLDVSRDVLAARLGARHGHFFPATLLESQLADLEPPQPAERLLVVAETGQPAAAIVDGIIRQLQLRPPPGRTMP